MNKQKHDENRESGAGDQERLIRHLLDALKRIAECEDAPDIDATGEGQTGLHCGVEDRGCRDRYEGADYGHTVGVEKGLEWAVNEAKHALESRQNVKEHAPLSAGASVDHGVEVETTNEPVNRAADRGCCVSSCCASSIPLVTLKQGEPDDFINTDGINSADIPERLRKMAEIMMKALDDSPPQTEYAKMLFSGVLCNIAHIMPWDGTCDESRSHIRSWLERNDPTSRKRDSRISNDPHQTQSRS